MLFFLARRLRSLEREGTSLERLFFFRETSFFFFFLERLLQRDFFRETSF